MSKNVKFVWGQLKRRKNKMVSENQLHIVAVTGFLGRDGQFLILKRSEKEIANPGEWTIPGGKVERGDTIIGTLEKEIKEETGLETDGEFEFIGDDEFTRPDGYHVVVPKFKCKAKAGEVKIDKKDFDDFAWVGPEDLDKYKIIPNVKKQMEVLFKR